MTFVIIPVSILTTHIPRILTHPDPIYQAISFHTVFQSKYRMHFLFILYILQLNLPGDSWSFTICLSVNCERLWTRLKQWLVLQLGHNVGSAMRPRSISTAVVFAQTMHLKNASLISGIMFDVRITMPLTVISWSISANRWNTQCYYQYRHFTSVTKQNNPILLILTDQLYM